MQQRAWVGALLAALLCVGQRVEAQDAFTVLSNPPKREFRASWVATVTNLDWPSAPGLAPDVQRSQLVRILDSLKAVGISAVILQVRPECDALYASSIEPWSYYLTGNQGTPPSPFYDPLAFAVEEAHKRGMELHAWFNPYRAVRSVGSYTLAPNHVSIQHPDWILTFGTLKMLDPGLPQVRDYVAGIVTDIARRYDVDGVHADDYFYPYPPNQITNQDDSTFARYPRGFTDRGAWRRDNVNLLIRMIHDSLRAVKPHVKFGMSPFGIWKNGVPPGITGLDAYNVIYCDAIAWLQQRTIDYLTPQLYWRIGGAQDYNALSRWWSDSVAFYGRHFYPGKIFGSNYAATELPNQVRIDRANPQTAGSVFFRASFFLSNTLGFADTCRTDFYRYPALHPVMRWKDTVVPYPPRAIRYARLPNSGPAAIQWDLPIIAPDGDSASRYVVYRFDHANIQPNELDSARNILSIEGRRYSVPKPPPTQGPWYYVATSLDRNYNESITSSVLTVYPPAPPVLAYPANGTQNLPPSFSVGWIAAADAGGYHLQVSSDSSFSGGLLVNDSTLVDTFRVITNALGQTTYYWRVRSLSAGGRSGFTAPFSFRTGFPIPPVLLSPPNYATNVPLNAQVVWRTAPGATSYRVQVATDFGMTQLLKDTAGVVDTSVSLPPLTLATVYFWRVNATNALGTSPWTDIWRFRTVLTSVEQLSEAPTEFALRQNFPNPFNPTTTIVFTIPERTAASLRVYDLLGREIAVLVDDVVQPGVYRVTFDASSYASGVYFYRLVAGGFVQTRKMQFIK